MSRSSRYEGYSWSGALNEPLATPSKSWMWCMWQLDGQWWRITDHDSAEAGNVPSWASVAEPLNAIGSPTRPLGLDSGAVMVGDGRRVAGRDRDRVGGRRPVRVGDLEPDLYTPALV